MQFNDTYRVHENTHRTRTLLGTIITATAALPVLLLLSCAAKKADCARGQGDHQSP
jgi:hypothetical protein